MRGRKLGLFCLFCLLLAGLSMLSGWPAQAGDLAQDSTGTPPAAAPPGGATVTVRQDTGEDHANVRSGPGTDYAAVGSLPAGQQAQALGRSPGGDWVKIVFPGAPEGEGWVYSPLVDVQGELPVVEPPPTPTPAITPTVDPTLAAQFIVEQGPTRLPTFTPPPPLVIPTFTAQESRPGPSSFPIAYVIIGLFVAGFFGTLISLLRGR